MTLSLLGETAIGAVFERIGYLAPFCMLVAAGAGLPLPEEVTLVGSGFLVFKERVDLTMIIATCYVATLIGDSIPFWVGRKLGMTVMEHRFIAKMVHPERRALIEERFRRHMYWGTFTCRFLPGIRLPGFFTAGTLGMSYPRFLLVDGLAALILTPVWILIGRAFGEKIATLEGRVQDLNLILGFALLAVLIFIGVRLRIRVRERQLALLERREERKRRQGEEG